MTLHTKGETQGIMYKIGRVNPKTGYYETLWFHGSKCQIPKGWHIVINL